ncbi:MAG TPA: HD domain-containing protein [Dehalococcoidia bacterium]|nr:HD domain-containing protein [Dehalococcoidia bacterium]
MSTLTDFPLTGPRRQLVSELAAFFEALGVHAYAVGGLVRDALLDRPFNDLDIGIEADPLELAPQIASAFEGTFFMLDEERRIVRVLLPEREAQVDLQRLKGAIEEDLRTRDFTIDAMGAELPQAASGRIELIDPAGGFADLRARSVRAVSEANLVDDPLRLLRGVRLAAVLDFEIEPDTAEIIRRNARLLATSAAERQRDELMLILGSGRARRGLRLMDELGLLSVVIPELDVTRGVDQPKEHHWDVFNHSIESVAAMEMLLSDEAPEKDAWLWRELWSGLGWWPEARAATGGDRAAVLMMACLLHDIGKPATKTFQEDGRMRFFGHAEAGAAAATKLLTRLRFPSRQAAAVSAMIDAHMRPLQMAQQGAPTDRAIYRFFRDTAGAGADTLLLSLADHLAAVGPRVSEEGWRRHVAIVSYILRRAAEDRHVIMPPRLIDGDELMAELGIPPGKELGKILEMIREGQAAGEVKSREDGLRLARAYLEGSSASRDNTTA